ncbi:hypothetical protein ACFLWS_01185 [Chloroflexota bacterium]
MVGVDTHKKKHAAVFVTQDFMTRSKLKFDNSREGFETILERARTGAYHWRNLAYFFA